MVFVIDTLLKAEMRTTIEELLQQRNVVRWECFAIKKMDQFAPEKLGQLNWIVHP
jgi:hypothetical protein